MVTRTLTPNQLTAIERLYVYDHTILVAGTGVGKTVIALTAIRDLIDEGILHKVIVACPAKVLENNVWENEARAWDDLELNGFDVDVVSLRGSIEERKRLMRVCNPHVWVVSLDNLAWLLEQDHGADGIVIDELSKAAGKQTAGLKSKKKAGMLIWRVGMTATPVSQDFQKLYGMCRIIDEGRALGTNKNAFLMAHFYPDYMGYNWTLKDNAEGQILGKVSSLVHLMNDNKIKELPTLTEEIIEFDMPADTRAVYNMMKKEMVVEGREAANQAVKSGCLRQLASGFIYNDHSGDVLFRTTYDTARLDTAIKWMDALKGKPGLIFYEFVYQGLQLLELMPGNIQIAQIQSMSHGIDGLQHEFADVLFYQPVWSRDLAEQAIGRVWRQGQTQSVRMTTLSCRNTLDQLVLARVEDRGKWMELFREHLKGE